MRNKILIHFVYILLSFSLVIYSTTPPKKNNFICPVCNNSYTALVYLSAFSPGKRLDLKPLAPYPAPLPLPVCPKCKFVLFNDSLNNDEITKYKKIIASNDFKENIPGNTSYFLLGKIFELEGKDDLTIAYTYLKASWEVDRKRKLKIRYLSIVEKYLKKYINSNSTSQNKKFIFYNYFLIEILRLQGEFKSAKKHLMALKSNEEYSYQPYRTLLQYEEKLIRWRRRRPKIIPEIKYTKKDEMHTLAGKLLKKSSALMKFNQYFEIKNIDAKYGLVGGCYISQEQWMGHFKLISKIPCDCQAELVFPIDSTDSIIVGLTAEVLSRAFEEICNTPFVKKILSRNDKNQLRIRASGDRLHWDTKEVEIYRKILNDNGINSFKMNDWIQIILETYDDKGQHYIDYYHPIDSDIFIADDSMYTDYITLAIYDKNGKKTLLKKVNRKEFYKQ